MQPTRRERRRRRIVGATILVGVGAAAAGWWYWRGPGAQPLPAATAASTEAVPVLDLAEDSPFNDALEPIAAARQDAGEPIGPGGGDVVLVADEEKLVPESGASETVAAPPTLAEPAQPEPEPPVPAISAPPQEKARPADEPSNNPAIAAAQRRYRAGEVIEARHELNRLLQAKLPPEDETQVRALLTTIAAETIFSKRPAPRDPLVDTYVIAAGDKLLEIGQQFDVPPEILMTINGITDARTIRPGQRIKVVRGPFRLEISKSKFRLDVYLQDLFVRSFPVGLGANGRTPEGQWKVKERLPNPTFYPPASAADKRIIPGDDPNNPLGEHWIGLEGIEGEALGQEGFGIHGTMEPSSIGRAVSLGCVRMHNEDVGLVYSLVLPGRSTVVTLP